MENDENAARPAYVPPRPREFALPNGTRITMDAPKVSISRLTRDVLQDLPTNVSPTAYLLEKKSVRALLHITHVNGQPEPKICDPLMRYALEEKIGEQYLDAILEKCQECFPEASGNELEEIRKS